MGPFKTVGGLHASGWQIAIFYRGTAIVPAHAASLKFRLGILGEGEAPGKAGVEPHLPLCPCLQVHLELPVDSALVFSIPDSLSCFSSPVTLQKGLKREARSHCQYNTFNQL